MKHARLLAVCAAIAALAAVPAMASGPKTGTLTAGSSFGIDDGTTLIRTGQAPTGPFHGIAAYPDTEEGYAKVAETVAEGWNIKTSTEEGGAPPRLAAFRLFIATEGDGPTCTGNPMKYTRLTGPPCVSMAYYKKHLAGVPLCVRICRSPPRVS